MSPSERRAGVFRVFLSLRFDEHDELARATAERLREYAMLAVYLNDDRADSASPTARSLRELERCDTVVLFIGETRGPVGDSGRTIVEQELQHAVDLLKPIHAYFSPRITEASPTWPLMRRVKEEQIAVTYGTLSPSPHESAMRVVADIQSVPLGSAEAVEFEPLVNGPGIEDEALLLGFEDHLTEPVGSGDAPAKLDLLQRQAWAFQAIRENRPGGAIEHLSRARDIRQDDWLTNHSQAWISVNTGSHRLLRSGIDAGRSAVETAEHWRAANEADGSPYPIARRDASRLLLARLLAVSGDYDQALELIDTVLERSADHGAALRERLRVGMRSENLALLLSAAGQLRVHHVEQLHTLIRSSELQMPFRSKAETAIVKTLMPTSNMGSTPTGEPGAIDRQLQMLSQDLSSALANGRIAMLDLESRLLAVGRELWPDRRGKNFAFLDDVVEVRDANAAIVTDLERRLEIARRNEQDDPDVVTLLEAAEAEASELRGRLSSLREDLESANDAIHEAEDALDQAEDHRGESSAVDALLTASPVLLASALLAVIWLVRRPVADRWATDWPANLLALALAALVATALARVFPWEDWQGWLKRSARWSKWRRTKSGLLKAERALRSLDSQRASVLEDLKSKESEVSDLRTKRAAIHSSRSEISSLCLDLDVALAKHQAAADLHSRLTNDEGAAADSTRVKAMIRETLDEKDRISGWAGLLLDDHRAFWRREVGRITTVTTQLAEAGFVRGGFPRAHCDERLVRLTAQLDDATWLVSDLSVFAESKDEVTRFQRLENFVRSPYGQLAIATEEVSETGNDWDETE